MTDFIEYIPKRHGQKPDYWTPDTLTGLDNKNYVRQPNWAWIAGTTYYVPYEAVHGMSRDVDELLTDGAGTLDDYQRGALDERAKIVAWLRGQGEFGSERAQVWGETFAYMIEEGEHETFTHPDNV